MCKLALAITCFAALLVGCQHSSPKQDNSSATSPSSSEYPQLFWMFTLYEVPTGVELAPDGTLRRAVDRGNGLAEVSAAELGRVFASIEAYPATRALAAPAMITQPGALGCITAQDLDKAGASIGPRTIEIRGTLGADGLSYELELSTAPGEGCGTGKRHLPSGSAVLLLCRGADASKPMSLLVLRQSTLNSPADHPFQRAAAGPAR